MAIQQPGVVQHAPKKKKKPSRFWSRTKKGFITSIYVTYVWEWFLTLAGRLVQMVLFFTIMYNIVQSYPGFVSPGAWIDQLAFMLQNGALDIGSFGLPRLADQAIKDGNLEGAEKAMQTSKALFWIMISNLVWGGVEHVIGSGMPDGVKTFVALVFLVIRAYYAISYTKVVHALKKEEEEEVAPSEVQGVQAESEQVQSLRAEVQSLTREVQALVQQASSVQVQGQGGAIVEVQTLREEVQALIGEVQSLRQVQGGAMPEGHPALTEVQDQISEVQDQVQGQLAEVLAQLARVQEGASIQMRPTVVGVQEGAMPQVQGAIELNAPRQSRGNGQSVGATREVQQASCESRVQGARVQGVQTKGAMLQVQGATSESQGQQPASVEVQGATDEGQLVQHNTEPLHLPVELQVQGGATPPGFRETIFAYVLEQVQSTGKDPTVKEIQVGVGCGERTAKSYRSAAIAKAREASYAG